MSTTMDEHEFHRVAEKALRRIEGRLGDLDPDDVDVTLSMGVLTLEFTDKARFVINSHRAARQIWMAANVQAWHFSYDPAQDRWFGDRNGEELFSTVAELVSSRVGYPVEI